MRTLTKGQRRELRALADEAYRRELNMELEILHERFRLWSAGEVDPFQLCEEIHRFHQGPARDLFVRFRDDPGMAVGLALSRGVLEQSLVSPELLEKLASWIHFFRQRDC